MSVDFVLSLCLGLISLDFVGGEELGTAAKISGCWVSRVGTNGADEISQRGDLSLDIARLVVNTITGEGSTSRSFGRIIARVEVVNTRVITAVVNSRDIEVSVSVGPLECDLGDDGGIAADSAVGGCGVELAGPAGWEGVFLGCT